MRKISGRAMMVGRTATFCVGLAVVLALMKVAFTSYRPGFDGTTDGDVWRMRATDGANPTNRTDNAVLDFDPEWQPVP